MLPGILPGPDPKSAENTVVHGCHLELHLHRMPGGLFGGGAESDQVPRFDPVFEQAPRDQEHESVVLAFARQTVPQGRSARRPPEFARAGSLSSVARGRSHRSPGSRPFVPGVVHKAVHRCGLPTAIPRPTDAPRAWGPRAWRASESRSGDVAAWRGCPAPERYTGVRVAASGRSDLGVCR